MVFGDLVYAAESFEFRFCGGTIFVSPNDLNTALNLLHPDCSPDLLHPADALDHLHILSHPGVHFHRPDSARLAS